MSSIAGAGKVFITTRRRTCPIAIGRTFPGRGLRGRSVAAAMSGTVWSGIFPEARSLTKLESAERPVTPAWGWMGVVTKRCKIGGVIKSGSGLNEDVAIAQLFAQQIQRCPGSVEGQGTKSAALASGVSGEGLRGRLA